MMRTWQKWIDGAGRWAKGCWEEWAAQRRAAQQEKEERRGHTGAAGERGTGVHKQEWASRAEGQGEVTTGVGVERKGVGRGSVEGCTSTPGRMGGREQRARESEMEAVREGRRGSTEEMGMDRAAAERAREAWEGEERRMERAEQCRRDCAAVDGRMGGAGVRGPAPSIYDITITIT